MPLSASLTATVVPERRDIHVRGVETLENDVSVPAVANNRAASLTPVFTAFSMVVLVLAAISLARSADVIVPIWPAGGVAVAVWLRRKRDLAFDFSFGALVAVGIAIGEFLAGNGPMLSLVFTVVNMIEIVLAVLLVRRFAPYMRLATLAGTWRFLSAASVVAPIPSALVGALVLSSIRAESFITAFQTWWFGHSLGLAIMAPMILAFDRRYVAGLMRPARLFEGAALLALLGGLCWFVFFHTVVPAYFILMPAMILIATRFRMPGIGLALAIITTAATVATMMPNRPLDAFIEDLPNRLVLGQLMLMFACVPVMLVAALLNERDHLAERARSSLRRAELASAAKSRLLANVAHEIKSPVAGVIGIGELWSNGQLGPVTPSQKEMAEMLVKTARQVEALAHDLLDVARAESGAVRVELRPTDVAGLIGDVRRTTALRADAQGLKLELEVGGESLIATADSQRLRQVIDNLAVNAIKYGSSGGVVIFRGYQVDDRVRIEVADKGPGMDADMQTQLFEPFNRLGLERSSIEGHGVGLALAKRLVELQGGAIGVTSEPGQGATFWVELPIA